jgi:hypothetical protein
VVCFIIIDEEENKMTTNEGHENPLEGLEDKIGKAFIQPSNWVKNEYMIIRMREEELVEVVSALNNWVDNNESDAMYEEESFMTPDEVLGWKYSIAVVKAFLKGINTPYNEEHKELLEALGMGN